MNSKANLLPLHQTENNMNKRNTRREKRIKKVTFNGRKVEEKEEEKAQSKCTICPTVDQMKKEYGQLFSVRQVSTADRRPVAKAEAVAAVEEEEKGDECRQRRNTSGHVVQ
ncbi:conserved hypothetical protein [Trichinella spiralis]|uniref:Uncharacterized protein n=1 Tax=Trichinella spiralis TaxID=6334 RepID=E5SMK0_TRISP|nr:conserved hypothetical protein [Trichinella spiralis]KRY27781.1 hypothetical protein T01_6813 [Trichinella spiralis]